jgi:hypothetical protein
VVSCCQHQLQHMLMRHGEHEATCRWRGVTMKTARPTWVSGVLRLEHVHLCGHTQQYGCCPAIWQQRRQADSRRLMATTRRTWQCSPVIGDVVRLT